ncbi:DUF3592 domain-containing protein [Kitasatospora sp. GAS204B]|uniref:DUF3592 domain-containing protein n=1 Tax=unclassified Kitasatospora TaxID=2633591 RepID=UPI0024735A28|nr:DUF3592 domain-containing protein [Kitasatospora sp. GAS204B]
MTTIEDQRPPTPEDQRPRAAPTGTAPRARRWRERAGRAMRTFQRLACAAVLVGAAVTAFAPWGSDPWFAGWVGASIAAGLAALAAPVRVVLSQGRQLGAAAGALFNTALSTVLLCLFAGLFAFALSGLFHEQDRDRHATLRVPATVTDCQSDSDSSTACTYHWLVDGRAYSTRDGAADQWPDGHQVSVRIDPAHPARAGVLGGDYWGLWIGIVLGALGTPIALGVWWVTAQYLCD